MKVKYSLEFSEEIEDASDITEAELTKIKQALEEHLSKFISYSGVGYENFNLKLKF